jgi:hypothetical protein
MRREIEKRVDALEASMGGSTPAFSRVEERSGGMADALNKGGLVTPRGGQ